MCGGVCVLPLLLSLKQTLSFIFSCGSGCALETFLATSRGLGSREMATLSSFFSHLLLAFCERGWCSTGSEFYTIVLLFPCSVHPCVLLPSPKGFKTLSPLKPALKRVSKRSFGGHISSPAIIKRYLLQEKVIISVVVVVRPGKGLPCLSMEKKRYLQMRQRNWVFDAYPAFVPTEREFQGTDG